MPAGPDPVTVTSAVLRRWPLPRGHDKESRGRVLVVGGSVRTPGAVLLAAEACLRSGAGKVQVATAASVAPSVAVALPEALVVGLPESADGHLTTQGAGRLVELAADCVAVLVGPGLEHPERACDLVAAVAPGLATTTVLDALALAYVTEHPDGLHHLAGAAILTPNTQELAITCGATQDAVAADTAECVLRLAGRARAVVSCGGSTTWTADPDGALWCDETGGAGLGTAGSGDVRAGVVAGIAARGAGPAQAAVWGAHVHGRAGDRLAADVGPYGFLARELSPQVPRVLTEIEG